MTENIIKIDGKWYIDLDLFDEKEKENNQLQQKINKAIDYIKEDLYEVGGCIHGSDLPVSAIEPILEILGDKENESN